MKSKITIFEQDIDAAYIVFVPEGYQFSLVFDGLSADIDLFLYELNSDYELQGRDPIDSSRNTGLGPNPLPYPGNTVTKMSIWSRNRQRRTRLLLLTLPRLSPAMPTRPCTRGW